MIRSLLIAVCILSEIFSMNIMCFHYIGLYFLWVREEKVRSEEISTNIALATSQCTTGQPWPRSRSRYVQLPGWLGERGGLILFHFVPWKIFVTWHGMVWEIEDICFFTSPQNFENNILTGGSFWVPMLPHRRDWGCQEVPILNFTIAHSILFFELEMFSQLLSIQYFSRTRDVLAKIDIIPNLNRSTADLICAGHSGSWVAELDHPGWSTSK